MKRLYKITAVLLSIVFMAGLFFACTNTDEDTSKKSNHTQKKQVGIIQFAPHPSLDNCYKGIVQGLRDAGFVDGETLSIDYQNANADVASVSQIAKSMTAKKYDVIFAIATPAAIYSYAETAAAQIPLVFCAVNVPVDAKLVPSMEQAGAFITGTSDVINLDEQFQLIRACQPDAKKVGILYTTGETNSVSTLARAKELAPKYGFEIVAQSVQQAADIPQAAASLSAKVDCLNNFTDNNVVTNLQVVLAKANAAGVPVYGSEIEQVKNGCLASASIDYVALGAQTGAMGAKILGGTAIAAVKPEVIQDSFLVINTDIMKRFDITNVAGLSGMEQVTTSTKS